MINSLIVLLRSEVRPFLDSLRMINGRDSVKGAKSGLLIVEMSLIMLEI